MAPPDRYCVAGNPVAHSKSPLIHAAFAAQTGQHISYEKMLVAPGEFAARVREFGAHGGRGLNVTVPFKEDAFRLADHASPAASLAGAVNTLTLSDAQSWQGDNTDGTGLMRDLCGNHGFSITDARVLLCGAGGAARGVLAALLEARPASVLLANRTLTRARQVAKQFQEIGTIECADYQELGGRQFDLIINATSLGLTDQIPPLPAEIVTRDTWCYDMMYGDRPTVFQAWAGANGATRSLDGLGMLVEQAAESFYIWRGVRPATPPVIEALRAGTLR